MVKQELESAKPKAKKRRHADDAKPLAPPEAAAAAAASEQHVAKKRKKKRSQADAPAAAPAAAAAAPPPAGQLGAPKSNWASLKATLDAAKLEPQAQHRRRPGKGKGGLGGATGAAPAAEAPPSAGADAGWSKLVAMDCEMVGVGANGVESALARVCIVDCSGSVVLDEWVAPGQRVTDFRTHVSGVRPANLRNAAGLAEVQGRVAAVLRGRVLVGHALENDLQALQLRHPRRDTRDTSRFPPLMNPRPLAGRQKPRALRHLALEHLGLAIQEGEHSPVDDARAALYLYQKYRRQWERWLAGGGPLPVLHPEAAGGNKAGGGASTLALARADYMADL